MSVGTNIRALRDRFDLTQDELAEKLGVTRESVHRWETDKIAIRDRHVAKMVELFGIDPDDIKSVRFGLAGAERMTAQASNPPNAIPARPSEPAYAPLLGRVHAGDACEPDVLDDRIPLPKEVADAHPAGYFLQVEGQCMSRVYPEGCFILIDPEREPSNGSIAVVSIDGSDYVMRRMYRGATTLVLSPESWEDGFEDIVVTQGDGRTVEFHGSVVWFQASREME